MALTWRIFEPWAVALVVNPSESMVPLVPQNFILTEFSFSSFEDPQSNRPRQVIEKEAGIQWHSTCPFWKVVVCLKDLFGVFPGIWMKKEAV
jgi:hypothetical protein